MDSRYHTFWRRGVAAVIDGLVLLPISMLLGLTFKTASPAVVYVALVLDYIAFFAYSIYLHGRYGQTIGKWLMKVRVLSIDEARLTMRQAALRDALPVFLAVLFLLFAIGPTFSGLSPSSREFKEQIPTLVQTVGLIALALEIGTMLTNRKRRSVNDFIAGSVVVRDARSESAAGPDERTSV